MVQVVLQLGAYYQKDCIILIAILHLDMDHTLMKQGIGLLEMLLLDLLQLLRYMQQFLELLKESLCKLHWFSMDQQVFTLLIGV